MTTNTGATLYHRSGNDLIRTVIARVMWQQAQDASFETGGKRGAENTRVFIPFAECNGEIETGDYLVRGECPFYGHSIAELTKGYKPLTITSVVRCDYGSAEMQHWEVTGK